MVLGLAPITMSSLTLIVGVIIVLYIIFRLGHMLLGLLVNTILGFISLFALNSLFGLGIPFDLIAIIMTAILGLPGVAIIAVLKILGITV